MINNELDKLRTYRRAMYKPGVKPNVVPGEFPEDSDISELDITKPEMSPEIPIDYKEMPKAPEIPTEPEPEIPDDEFDIRKALVDRYKAMIEPKPYEPGTAEKIYSYGALPILAGLETYFTKGKGNAAMLEIGRQADLMGGAKDRYQSELSDYASQKGAIEKMLLAEGKTGGGDKAWQQRSAEFEIIQAMPDGPDKDVAMVDYYNKWSPGTGYGASPRAIEQAGKKAAAGITGRAEGEEEVLDKGIGSLYMKTVDDLRTNFQKTEPVQAMRIVKRMYDQANDLYKKYKQGRATPYEFDQSMGYFAAKALDYNSVVREGEFNRFIQGLGFTGSVTAFINQLIKGGLQLSEDAREALYGIVQRSYGTVTNEVRPYYDQYVKASIDRNVEPIDIVGPLSDIFEGQFKLGETYKDADNNAGTYMGNGYWKDNESGEITKVGQ